MAPRAYLLLRVLPVCFRFSVEFQRFLTAGRNVQGRRPGAVSVGPEAVQEGGQEQSAWAQRQY